MAHQNIVMKKIKTLNSIVYYHVFDYINNFDFFMGIHKEEKLIKCYLSNNFAKEPLTVIDFSDPSKQIGSIPGINNSTAIRASFLAYKAVLNNDFPEILSYVSS